MNGTESSYLMFQGIPELRLLHQAIHNVHITPLRLECPKHSIPNDQHRPIILVQTVSVYPMVNLNNALCVIRILFEVNLVVTLWWLAVLRM